MIYEIVNVSDEEQYFTMGFWLTEAEARAAINDGTSPEDYNIDNPETYVKIAIWERKLGWSDSYKEIAHREWTESWFDDDYNLRDCGWREIHEAAQGIVENES